MSVNHGANLYDLSKKYGFSKDEFLDFSSNINPFGTSSLAKEYVINNINMVSVYPDVNYSSLKKSISSYCKCNENNIVLGSGATELISSFINTIKPKKAVLISPAYSEYERELKKHNCEIIKYFSRDYNDFKIDTTELVDFINEHESDLIIICNPNNPTGFTFSKFEMEVILNNTKAFVMVDETYEEFAPLDSKISSIPLTNNYNNLIVLRGISKFFAAPGLRLGYAVTGNPDLLKYINTKKNPWTINSLAEIAGCIMFSDKEYIDKTRALISGERERLFNTLSSWKSVKVYPSCSNFLLIKILKEDVTSEQVFDYCIRRGLMIRDCSTFPFLDNSFIRFCMMSPEKNNELLQALSEILGEV